MKRGKCARLAPVKIRRDCTKHMGTPRENVVPYCHILVVVWKAVPPRTGKNDKKMRGCRKPTYAQMTIKYDGYLLQQILQIRKCLAIGVVACFNHDLT